MSPVVLIFGATSGIASELAKTLALKGESLFLAGRDEPELMRLAKDIEIRYGSPVKYGVYDANCSCEETERFIQRVKDDCGELKGCFVAIGALGDHSLALVEWEESSHILESNFNNVVKILHCLAPVFEDRKSGWIAVASSVAGDRGRLSNYIYGSAKGGLSIYLQGFRARMHRSGVQVLTVKPGPVDTAMTFGMDRLPLLANPSDVAKSIERAIQSKKDVLYVPGPWLMIMFVLRHIPEKIFKKLSI